MKRFIMLVLLLLIAATHIQAQDTEPAPTVEIVTNTPAPEVTAIAPVGSEPTVAPVVTAAPAPATERETSLWQFMIGMLLSFIAGGGFTLAGVGVVVRYVKNDKAIIALGEHLYHSMPVNRQTAVRTFSSALSDVATVVDEITDDIPAADKPSVPDVDNALYSKSAA